MGFLKRELFQILLLILMTALIATLAIYFSNSFWVEEKVFGWERYVAIAMYWYLSFVCLRTLLHLFLSFGNLYFQIKTKKLSSFPMVSIILPCYNEEKVVAKAVESALKINYSNFEILIIDDGSKDATLEIARKLEQKAKVRVIHQRNGGKAAALNRGISESLGSYVFCLDADSILDPEVIRNGLVHFHNNPKLAAVAGKVEIGNVNNAITSFQRLEYVSGLNLFKVAQSFLKSVTVIPGPVGLFRKDRLLEVGGYKSNTYAEDCELTLRLLLAGYETVYEPMMVATTEAPEDFRSLIAQRYRWSRGIIQAMKQSSHWLKQPNKNFRNFCILSYMTIESVIIPTANFVFSIFAIEYALIYGSGDFLGQFFLQMILLDSILAFYCVMTERQSISLIGYAIVNRFTYGLALEMLRFLSILDELIGLPMSWAKLARKGLK